MSNDAPRKKERDHVPDLFHAPSGSFDAPPNHEPRSVGNILGPEEVSALERAYSEKPLYTTAADGAFDVLQMIALFRRTLEWANAERVKARAANIVLQSLKLLADDPTHPELQDGVGQAWELYDEAERQADAIAADLQEWIDDG